MSSRTLYRLSGGTLIVSSVLILLASVAGAILFPGHSSTPQQVLGSTWPLVIVMGLIGSLLSVIGLPGMYLRQAGRAGALGLVGFILLFIAFLFQGTAFSTLQVTVLPWLAQKAPQLLAGNSMPFSVFLILLVSGVLQMIGAIVLGIATMRAQVFPRWAGGLLLASGIFFLLTIPPLPSSISDIIEVVSFACLALAFMGCGYSLIVGERGAAETAPFAATAQTSH